MKKNLVKNKTALGSGFILSFDLVMEIIFMVTIFVTPIIFDRRLGIVFSGTKIAWLRAFIVVALGVWVIKLIVTKQHRFVRTPLDWPILTFLLSATVATLTSVHVYTSFTGFYGRFEGLTTWYIFGLLFFITANYIYSFDQIKRIALMVVSAGTLMSVYGVIQRQEWDPYMWGGVITWQRVIGTIGQPNFLAAYILMAFFLGLALFMDKRKSPSVEIDWFQQFTVLGYFIFSQVAFVAMIYALDAQDIFLWYAGFALIAASAILFAFNYEKLHPLISEALLAICLVLIYVCLLYTQSRGGYMGLFTGTVLFTLIAGRHWIFDNWKKIAVLGAFIILISGITMLDPKYSPFERFAAEVSTKGEKTPSETKTNLELKGAAGSRGETWKSAFKVIADYPIFGIGPEVLKMVFPRYETELFRFKEAFHVKQDRCHNETFDVPVTKGMIAFFAYLWLVFTMFKVGFSKIKGISDPQRLMLAGLLAAALSYLIQNQFSFGVVAITSLFWVIWGMVMVLGQEREKEKLPKFSLAEIPWIPVSIVVLVGVFLLYVSFLSFRGDVHFKSGKTYMETGRLQSATEELQKSLKVFPFEGTTISHLGIAYLNLGNPKEAIKYLNYGVKVDPYNADNFYMLSRVYLSFYDQGSKEALAEAQKDIEITLKIDPYYAEAYDVLGQIYERQGKAPEAAKMYEKAFMVNPNLAEPMARMEAVYRRMGQAGEARKSLEKAAKKYPESLELLKILGRLK